MTDPDEALRWTRLGTRPLLDASPWLRVHADRLRRPDGSEVDDFLRIEAPDYAVIFAVTPAILGARGGRNGGRNRGAPQVVTVRQYKAATEEVVLALPAGRLDPGETPEEAAHRELREETGYVAARWEYLGAYATHGNWGAGNAHLFLAHDAVPAGAPQNDAHEPLTVALRPLEQIEMALRHNELRELCTVACAALAMARLSGSHARE